MEHSHVLLTEREADGQVKVKELVPAERVDERHWRVTGTPGLLIGCAAGDLLVVNDDGTFAVNERGDNLAAHVYGRTALPAPGLESLRESFDRLGGSVEWPETRRFAVVTVPVAAGFPAVEPLLEEFVRTNTDTEWIFGNVYDSDGTPLNWW